MAAFAKLAAFLRKHTPAVAAVGLSASVILSILPQTFGLPRYKQLLLNLDRDGKETPISGGLQLLIDRVIGRMKITAEEESRIDMFVSYPHNPVHKGSVQLRTGAIIGLPASFLYTSTEELAAVKMLIDPRVSKRIVDWTSESGLLLLDSLVLSDKAKAFVIARELQYATAYDLHVDIGLRSLCGVLAYTTGSMLNASMQMTQRLKLGARVGVFSLIGAAWLLMYVQINDAVCCWRDNRSDRKAARLTRAYAEGGVEYYESVLRRNKALRMLLGPAEGPRQYTLFGNETSTIRNPHVQLTARRDNLVKYLKEYETPGDAENEQRTDESDQSVQ